MDCNDFFDFNSLNQYVEFDKPLYSIIAKRRTAKLVYVSPKQYIYKIAQGFGGLSYDDVISSGAVIQSNIDKYAEAMKSGAKFPIGYYTKDGDQQEGRHRALAAMRLGCDKIPVIQFMKISDKEFSNVVNKLKDKSFDELDALFKKIGFQNGITRLGYNDLQRYVEYNIKENTMKLNEVRNIVRKVLSEQMVSEALEPDYKAWKRNNVTLRGMSDVGRENSAGARFGNGLYTAFLGNRAMAKEYGKVYFAVGAIPKNPVVVNDANQAEIWIQYNLYKFDGEDLPNPKRFYDEGKTIEGEMLERGYDGLVIKGREMVNYAPGDDVMYFDNENHLIDYYEYNVRNKQ